LYLLLCSASYVVFKPQGYDSREYRIEV
jgi:hypothetical protein